MKTRQEILESILDREVRTETTQRPLRLSLRERLSQMYSMDPAAISKRFGVKIETLYIVCDSETKQYRDAEAKDYRVVVLEAVRKQIKIRKAKQKAAEIGLHYWPALLNEYPQRIDPLAYLAAETVLLEKNQPWQDGPKGTKSHGGWDSCGHWGISPQAVVASWLMSGCKNTPKFRHLIRRKADYGVYGRYPDRKIKAMSLRELVDFQRGERWVCHHFGIDNNAFSTKAVTALGRISPAARQAATATLRSLIEGEANDRFGRLQEVDGVYRRKMIRIRDLDWSAVKALQDMPKAEITQKYLWGHYAWQFLHGEKAPKGLERVSPIGWSKDQSGAWISQTMCFSKFGIKAPGGYLFGVDENGLKIFVKDDPEADFHFTEKEMFRGNCLRYPTDLVAELNRNAGLRAQQKAEKRRDELMMKNLSNIRVTVHDSIRAGNCAAGTKSFADRHGIDLRRMVRGDFLLRVSKGDSDDRVMNVLRAAWARETLVQI